MQITRLPSPAPTTSHSKAKKKHTKKAGNQLAEIETNNSLVRTHGDTIDPFRCICPNERELSHNRTICCVAATVKNACERHGNEKTSSINARFQFRQISIVRVNACVITIN